MGNAGVADNSLYQPTVVGVTYYMTYDAAIRLARYLRAIGYEVRLRRHVLPPGSAFYTVQLL